MANKTKMFTILVMNSNENHNKIPLHTQRAFLVAQMVKNLPTMQETQVQSLGWEDPLEKGMASHATILAWRIPWTDHGVAKSRT